MEESRYGKCKYCKNYQHQYNNINYPFKCKYDNFDCYNIYEMPKYDEVDDKTYRDKEIDDYNKRMEKKYESIDTMILADRIVWIFFISQMVTAIYLCILSYSYWLSHDNLTKIQLFKVMINQHPIVYGYLFVCIFIDFIISLL